MSSDNNVFNTGRTAKRTAFIINTLYFALIAAIIFVVFKYVLGWILPFLIGFIIAYTLRPVIIWLTKALRFKRNIASFVVILLAFACAGTCLTLLGARLIAAITDLLEEFPAIFNEQIYPALQQLMNKIGSITGSQTDGLNSVRELVLSAVKQAGTFITGLTTGLPGFLIGFIFTILSSLFISIYYEDFTSFVLKQMPGRMRKITRDSKKIFLRTLAKYVKAAIILMMITFAELSVALTIIGVKDPILTAAGISVFDALPVFGTGGIMVPWFALELLRGNYPLAIGLIISYGVVSIVRSFIEPKVVGDQLGLNPLASIFAVYLGFVWGGIPGMILMPIILQLLITLNSIESIKLYKMDD